MAKELPYFRFTAQEWQNGLISLETYELKGLFIDLCSYYWVQDCSVTKAMLEKRFRNDIDLLNQLFELEILKHESKTDLAVINYLNEQFDVLSEKRKRRQEAGRKGGKQKSSNAKAKPKQNSSYKDKDKDKDKDNIEEMIFDSSKRDLFKAWLNYRVQIKKPITATSTLDKLVDKINNESLGAVSFVINNSIENGWQGLFWDKVPQEHKQKSLTVDPIVALAQKAMKENGLI